MYNMYEMKEIIRFYDNLNDKESKKIFETRWKFIHDNNLENYADAIIKIYSDWHLRGFTPFYQRMSMNDPDKKIVIYGFGKVGKFNKKLLEKCGYSVSYIVDKNYKNLGGVESPDKLFHDRSRPIIVISISDIYEVNAIQGVCALAGKAVYRENVYYEAGYSGYLVACRGNQYFDLPYMEREKEEIFIDAGCYDGETTIAFRKWAGQSFKKSIAFECDQRNIDEIKSNMKDFKEKEFALYQKGLYSRRYKLHFCESVSSSSSRIGEKGKIVVPVDSIDNILEGEKITFIKMDIEGMELEALKGAEKTIIKWRPKLAISLYHRPEDLYEIPMFLMKIMPDYRFYIRHYSSLWNETVLYAI